MSISHHPEYDGRGTRVTLDNSARGNCFDDRLLEALASTLEDAARQPDCAVIRLDLVGPHFCGGWDTSSFGELGTNSTQAVADALRRSDETLARIRRLPVPVVAGVRGKVIGFGAGLLGAIHLPVAAGTARLLLPEVRFGFAPAGVGHLLAQTLPRAAAYALLTGTATATAAELLAWGLVARVVPAEDLDAAVDELVAALVALPGTALRGVVEVVESSRASGTPDRAYLASARTITGALSGGTS